MTTRAEAELSGAKTYTGAECKYGHTVKYLNGTCVACSRIRKKGAAAQSTEALDPATAVVKSTGYCKHGRHLRDTCRPCEVSWRTEPRVQPSDDATA